MLDSKLETLLTLAEYRSFTRTARILTLTQPAVSHHITLLEKELGVPIIKRGQREFELTPEGEIAVRYAKRLKSIYQKMRQDIQDNRKHLTRIRVGLTHTAESNIFTEVLAKYGNQSDNVSITILTDTVKGLYKMLENYEIDIAIVEGKVDEEVFNCQVLDTDILVCVLNPGHKLAKHSCITLPQLKEQNLILRLPTSATRQLFEASLMGVGESIDNFNITIEVDNISTIKDLVKKGMGASILPQSVCVNEVRSGKLKAMPIEGLNMKRDISLAYNKDFIRVDVLRDITDIYRETAGAEASK